MEKLCDLLQVKPGVTALIGGGGKTSLLYHLAEELRDRGTVLVCTTTKIWPPEHLPVVGEVDKLIEALSHYGVACAGTPTAQGKLTTPHFRWEDRADYVLVEADGSAGRPFKAHEAWEPMIPERCGNTVLVLGADGFGKPISKAAHRPAIYAKLAGVPENRSISPAVAAKVVKREGFHDRIFVNQTDTEKEWEQVRQLAEILDCPIVAGSLRDKNWKTVR